MTIAQALKAIGQVDLAQTLAAIGVIGLLLSFAIRQRISGPPDADKG